MRLVDLSRISSIAFVLALPALAAAQAPADPAPEPPVIRAYALIKPTVIFTADPVDSFGQPNASAPTAAGNPALVAIEDEPYTTFQAAQSRLGFWFAEKSPVRGHFEFDFIDFAKSSPTTGSLPRLRIAAIEWKLTDTLQLQAGQDWDLFQPVNPHTLNIVSVAFQAGNTGFMRHQFKLIHTTESLELGAAVGMQGSNNAARPGVPEFGLLPSLALRASLLFGGAGRVGISALGARWRFNPTQDSERNAFAGGVGLFGDVTPAERFNVRFEAYGGRNLGNTGALSIANGNATNDLDEFGAVLSAKYGFDATHALYALGGLAQALNDEDVLPSYAYPAAPMDMPNAVPALGTATAAPTGPGMVSNMTARLGYEYRYDKSIALLLEGFYYATEHKLVAADEGRLDAKQTAVGGEIGLLFTL